jgi:DMSO/TMAO reductase YedYZ molybdopterin-dependent catalytic subunit
MSGASPHIMRRPIGAWTGALVGAGLALVAFAVFVLAAAVWGLSVAPYDIFEAITRVLPGGVVTAGIDAMIRAIGALGLGPTAAVAKLAEAALAAAMFVIGSGVLGAIVARLRHRAFAAGAAGVLWLAAATAADAALARLTLAHLIWFAVVLLAWAEALAAVLDVHEVAARPPRLARRHFLAGFGATIAVGTAALFGASALVARFRRGRGPMRIDTSSTSGPAASPPHDALAARIAPAPGTRAELTPNDRFYRVDINLEPPRVDPQAWRLVVDGLVARRLALALDDLRAMPSITQAVTLECISNPVAGDLIGTSLWTGVRLRDVLDRAGVQRGARAVHVRAADGYYESVALDDVDDDRTLLVYAMGGEPLADLHGFPLRIYIPNRHGMKQPKWITHLHVADREGRGYWVDRGWSRSAIPHTTSVIDAIRRARDSAIVAIGGIAYAGARGIRKVELQIDRGPWLETRLVTPPLSPLCWVQWRYDWPYAPGDHVFRVRATDGTGALQDVTRAPPHPDGATGLHAIAKRLA